MGLSNSGGTPAAHHTSHENGGSDEIDATGLTGAGGGGASATAQTHAYRNGVGQSIPSGTLTAVIFDSEYRDDDGDWAVSPNPTRIIMTQDGTYDLVGQAYWGTGAGGTFRKAAIYKNGVLLHEYSHAAAAFVPQTVVAYSTSLVAGDYLELKVTQDSGSNISLLSGVTSTYLLASRGGDESLFPFDVMNRLRGGAPYGIQQRASDTDQDAYVSMPGDGTIDILGKSPTKFAEVQLNGPGGEVFIESSDEIFIEPSDGPVVIDSGWGLVLPAQVSDPTIYDEGQLRYATDTHRVKVVRAPDGFNKSWQDLASQGNGVYAFPFGWVPSGTYATAITLPANGGAIAIPMHVAAPMIVSNLDVYNTDTTGAREFEVNFYFDDFSSATGHQVDGDAYDFESWTSSGAALRSAAYATATPVFLTAGTIWVVIRNTHATNTLGLGSLAAAGTFAALNAHQTATLGSSLDTTLDLVTGWSKATGIPGIVLRGRALAQTSAW